MLSWKRKHEANVFTTRIILYVAMCFGCLIFIVRSRAGVLSSCERWLYVIFTGCLDSFFSDYVCVVLLITTNNTSGRERERKTFTLIAVAWWATHFMTGWKCDGEGVVIDGEHLVPRSHGIINYSAAQLLHAGRKFNCNRSEITFGIQKRKSEAAPDDVIKDGWRVEGVDNILKGFSWSRMFPTLSSTHHFMVKSLKLCTLPASQPKHLIKLS